MREMRRLAVVLAVLVGVAVGATAGGAAPAAAAPYAAVVMDARDGRILAEENADARLHPASLTKMMTLYLAIEAVESGRLDLDQMVPVSRYAASKPPSKVGFKPGTRVRVRDLIRSAAVKSANDSAAILAEAIAGSEAEFAKLMTRRARELGLKNTTFKNASGLTQKGHLSTARDMALLGRRLFFDWPEYYNLFGRKTTTAFGRTFRNTNKLLNSYRGADGIKTGYTNAAGFNLVASAERGEERVIVAVFGGRSSAQRNAKVAQLLDLGFAKAPTHVAVIPPGKAPPGSVLVAAASAPAPEPRPGAPEAQEASLFVEGARSVGRAIAPAAHAAVAPLDRVESPPRRVALVDATEHAPVRAEAPSPRGGEPIRVAGAYGDWSVQLGAYSKREIAVARLAAASFGSMPALAAAGREIDRAAGSRLWRARLTGLDSSVAREACRRLKSQGADCLALPPGR